MFCKLLSSIFLFCFFLHAQTFEWADIVPIDIQTNPAYLYGTVTTDTEGNPVSARLVNVRDEYIAIYYGDVRIEKRTLSGTVTWETTVFGKADISRLVVDEDNNVVGIGTYRDTISIGMFQLVYSGSGTGSFVLKLDGDGNPLWLKDGSEYFSGFGTFTALLCDDQTDILLGYSNYPVESRIIRLDASGNVVSTIQQINVETVSDMDIDAFGNLWVTGFVSGHQLASFNGFDTTSAFTYTEYVVKYNSSGNVQWVNFIEDITVQFFNIETDDFGNGYLSGGLFFGTSFGNLQAYGPEWVYDFFVTKISPDGDFLWLNEIPPGNTSGDAAIGNANFLSCSENGNTYITGFFRGTINFGNGVQLSSLIGSDVFVLSYNQDGIVQWAKAAGGYWFNKGSGIVTDNNGSCYVSGVVGANAIFDTISVAGGDINLFLARLNFDNPVSVDDELNSDNTIISEYSLEQNYPNPFNPNTVIGFQLPVTSNVSLKVFDLLGNEVATLVNEEKSSGEYKITFDASALTSGVYFYTLRAGKFTESKKMILLR
jgi:hypothetical protein